MLEKKLSDPLCRHEIFLIDIFDFHAKIMNIISRRHIIKYGKRQSSARKPLEAWYKIMSCQRFGTLQEMRKTFNSVDPVGDFTVFNIGGNNFRLIAKVNYQSQTCMIKKIMTHSEHDNWSAK